MHTHNPQALTRRVESRDVVGRPEVVFVLGAGAVSGAIMGFIFGGHVLLSAGAFAGISLGLIAGWWARGVAAS